MSDDRKERRAGKPPATAIEETPARLDEPAAKRPLSKRAAAKAVKKAKMCISVSEDFALRLDVVASMRRMQVCDLVEEQLGPYLRRWRLPSEVGTAGPIGAPEELAAT